MCYTDKLNNIISVKYSFQFSKDNIRVTVVFFYFFWQVNGIQWIFKKITKKDIVYIFDKNA